MQDFWVFFKHDKKYDFRKATLYTMFQGMYSCARDALYLGNSM